MPPSLLHRLIFFFLSLAGFGRPENQKSRFRILVNTADQSDIYVFIYILLNFKPLQILFFFQKSYPLFNLIHN